jgi:hypothetical protein
MTAEAPGAPTCTRVLHRSGDHDHAHVQRTQLPGLSGGGVRHANRREAVAVRFLEDHRC